VRLLLWVSCLQKVVAKACKHTLYLNNFFGLLDLNPTIKLIKMYYNTSAMTLATTSEAVHNQVKHVRTKVHYLHKMIANGYVVDA